MFAKFIGLLLLLFVLAGLAYVAIVDVDIKQENKIVSVKAPAPADNTAKGVE